MTSLMVILANIPSSENHSVLVVMFTVSRAFGSSSTIEFMCACWCRCCCAGPGFQASIAEAP